MTTAKTAGLSLADLDARRASESPYEFEYFDAAGEATGVFFQVLGDHSDQVTAEVNRLLNERRRKEAIAELKSRTGGRKAEAAFTPVEDDIAFGQRLAAVRLVGWRGIAEPYAPELALQLCQSNPHVAAAITDAASDLGNFTKASSKA